MLRVIIFSAYIAWFLTTAAADLRSPEPTDDWSIPTILTSATSASPVDSPTLIQGYADGQEYEVSWIKPDDRGSDVRSLDVSSEFLENLSRAFGRGGAG